MSITNNGTMCTPSSTSPAAVPFNFPPVDQGSAATVNDNARITGAKSGTGTPQGHLLGLRETSAWSAATRVLDVANNASLTLTGDVYSFCSLTVSEQRDAAHRSRAATPLKIYVDAPEKCGGGAGTGSVSVINNGLIQNLNTQPGDPPALRRR